MQLQTRLAARPLPDQSGVSSRSSLPQLFLLGHILTAVLFVWVKTQSCRHRRKRTSYPWSSYWTRDRTPPPPWTSPPPPPASLWGFEEATNTGDDDPINQINDKQPNSPGKNKSTWSNYPSYVLGDLTTEDDLNSSLNSGEEILESEHWGTNINIKSSELTSDEIFRRSGVGASLTRLCQWNTGSLGLEEKKTYGFK